MNTDQRDQTAQLAAFYNGNPAAIARRLGLPHTDVAAVFDTVAFTDLVQKYEGRLIQHAAAGLAELDLPIQATRARLSRGSHNQQVSLARDICVRLPLARRWPADE